jgi:hypothetical protein
MRPARTSATISVSEIPFASSRSGPFGGVIVWTPLLWSRFPTGGYRV